MLAPGTVVVNKSTVPVGSTRRVEQALGRSDVAVVSNPEFLREGSAVNDFLHPDRVVIGSDDQAAAIRVASLYVGVPAPLMVTDPASAETIKYASNAFLAAKLSFVNAVAALCEAVGADVNDVVLGMGYDKRIGHEFLRPGPGWGGSCFPKDVQALLYIAREAGYDFDLLQGVVTVNDQQFDRMADKIEELAGGSLSRTHHRGLGPHLQGQHRRPAPVARRCTSSSACWPAVPGSAATTRRCRAPSSRCPTSRWCPTPTRRGRAPTVLAVLTEWDEFKWLDLDKLAGLMAEPRILDTRNLLDRAAITRRGFTYHAVGRP